MQSTSDIRSESVQNNPGYWSLLTPAIDQDDLDVVQVLDGNQIGFYGSLRFGSGHWHDPSSTSLLAWNTAFAPETARHLQIGARSIGRARCYFLEPTSIEFNAQSRFSVTLSDGAVVSYLPDPTLDTQRIPSYPSVVFPADGAVAIGGHTLTSHLNFVTDYAIIAGDLLYLHFLPVAGNLALPSEVTNMANKSLVLSLASGVDQTIVFGNDYPAVLTSVTRSGIADQINKAVGRIIASVPATNHLTLIGDVDIIVRKTGTANALLGFSTTSDTNNLYDNSSSNKFTVQLISNGTLTVAETFPLTATDIKFEVRRPFTQRCSSTQMNANTAESKLYYFDVELVSEGTGDIYNIDSDMQMMATGYRSDGYYLTTKNPDLTFSVMERPTLHVSRSILEVGVSDSPGNATMLSGQNIEVTYERSTLVSDTQNFTLSETERVVCSNPLARHLIPHYVRFDFEYVGGSSSSVLVSDINSYILKLFPSDYLKSSDLVGLAYQRGATSVTSPLNLIAIVVNYDRTVQAQRSQNALNTGRLAAFIPDVINVNRRSG
jgi:hypothetical protein